MKKMLVVSVVVLAITYAMSSHGLALSNHTSAPQPQAGAPATAELIEQLERDRQQAFVHGDIAKLDQETAEDYTTINSGGPVRFRTSESHK